MEKIILVCEACGRHSCYTGEDECHKADTALLEVITVRFFEHSDYWTPKQGVHERRGKLYQGGY